MRKVIGNSDLFGYPDYSQNTNINSYQSAENAFECPSNGYIIMTRGVIASGTPVYCYINNNMVLVISTNSNDNIGGMLFPVKKGDLFYSTGFDYTYSRINFIPNR